MTTTSTEQASSARKPHQIHLRIENVEYTVSERELTGAQLKALAGIAPANHLFREVSGHREDEQILDNVAVALKDGMKFYDVPVGNFG